MTTIEALSLLCRWMKYWKTPSLSHIPRLAAPLVHIVLCPTLLSLGLKVLKDLYATGHEVLGLGCSTVSMRGSWLGAKLMLGESKLRSSPPPKSRVRAGQGILSQCYGAASSCSPLSEQNWLGYYSFTLLGTTASASRTKRSSGVPGSCGGARRFFRG